MIKLKVTKKDGYLYSLEDVKQNQYELNLDFINIDNEIEVNDTIEMQNDLLMRGKNACLVFGKMDSPYGRENLTMGDEDVIIIHKDEKEILLKRLYG